MVENLSFEDLQQHLSKEHGIVPSGGDSPVELEKEPRTKKQCFVVDLAWWSENSITLLTDVSIVLSFSP